MEISDPERGEGEDGDGHQDKEETKLLVGLLEGVEQGLKASKMPDKLVDPENPHHLHQPDDFSRLPDNLKILKRFSHLLYWTTNPTN